MRREAGRFGSSRKKEAAGAARWMLVAMGFECQPWRSGLAESGISAGRDGRKWGEGCRERGLNRGVRGGKIELNEDGAHFERGVPDGTPSQQRC